MDLFLIFIYDKIIATVWIRQTIGPYRSQVATGVDFFFVKTSFEFYTPIAYSESFEYEIVDTSLTKRLENIVTSHKFAAVAARCSQSQSVTRRLIYILVHKKNGESFFFRSNCIEKQMLCRFRYAKNIK